MSRYSIDLTGQTFGRWTVIRRMRSLKKPHGRRWLVRCICGEERSLRSVQLMAMGSKSCGCLQREVAKHAGIYTRKHGQSPGDFKTWSLCYRTWAAIIRRIDGADKYKSCSRYRGVYLNPAWREFKNFFADMGDRPSVDHSIDRIDNSKGYFKENCRWATAKEQARNRRSNLMFTLNGRTQCLMDWCNELGLKYETVYMRIRRGSEFSSAIGGL